MDDLNDGFKLVNRRKKGKERRAHSKSIDQKVDYCPIDEDNSCDNDPELQRKLNSRLIKSIDSLKEHKLTDQITRIFGKIFDNNSASDLTILPETRTRHRFTQAVSYGVGKFSQSREALYQLALIYFLKKSELIVADDWLIYDPIFTCNEKIFLNNLGFQVININEKGARKVSSRTLFFMPHCPVPMYNNLLWSNWSKFNLDNIIIIGTSLKTLVNSFRTDNAIKEYSYLIYMTELNAYHEHPLDPSQELYQAFNDMSIHVFNLIEEDNHFIEIYSDEKPVYSVFAEELSLP